MLPDEVRGRLDRAFPDSGALAGAGGESGGGEHQRAERSMTLTESFIVRRDAGEAGALAGSRWRCPHDRVSHVWRGPATGAIHRPGAAYPHPRGRGRLRHQRGPDVRGRGPPLRGVRGELVWLPRQVPHTFANLGDEPVWAFGVTTPAGLEGMFEDQRAYFAGLQGAPDPDRIREIGARYGVRSLGPPISLE